MSSLPSCVASAFDFNDMLNTAATTAPPISIPTGNTIKSTNTMMNGPKSTIAVLAEVRPRLDFDECADR